MRLGLGSKLGCDNKRQKCLNNCQVEPEIERDFEPLKQLIRTEDQSMLFTLKTPEVKCLKTTQKRGEALSKMANILDNPSSEKISENMS